MTSRVVVLLVPLGMGCLGEGAGDEVNTAAGALVPVPVTWTDTVNVEAVGNDLRKTNSKRAWNAGAVSVESLTGDGFVEFTTGENFREKMAGLSNGNDGTDQSDIDFAIELRENGTVGIREGGVAQSGNFGTYLAGDLFRVQVLGSDVTYWRNGELLFTSGGTPSFPLLVDTALRRQNATISDVVLESLAFWQNLVGVSAAGNDLTKTSTEETWSAGASSIASLTDDGYAEFTSSESTTAKMAGLSSGDGGPGQADIDFAIYLKSDGSIAIREGGMTQSGDFGTYAAGDLFRVEVAGGVVTYVHNGEVIYASTGTPSFPLLLDTSLRTPGATLENAQLRPTASVVFENPDRVFRWKATCNCVTDVQGITLDLTSPPEEQFGQSHPSALELYKVNPAVGLITAGGFWIRSTGAFLAAGETFVIPGSEQDVFVTPPAVKSVGDVVGPDDTWVNGEPPFPSSEAGLQTAHLRDTFGGTGPSQIWFTDGIIGVRFAAQDGIHYGFVEVDHRQPGTLFLSRYAPIRWGYNPVANEPLVIPP